MAGNGPTSQDFKKATDLPWEVIRIEAELRSLGGDAARTSGAAAKLREKKRVILDRSRDVVQAWDCHGQASWWNWWPRKSQVWAASERKGLDEIKALVHRLHQHRRNRGEFGSLGPYQ